MAGSLKDCPGTAGNHSTANFEYDDNEWDIGIGDLIIDLDADIEKTGVGEGMAAPKPGKMHSPVEHQATVDKGLKMKIKRTKPGTKHEIVKSENVEKKRGSGHKKDKKHEKGAAKDMNGVRLVAVEGGSGAVQPQVAVPPAASSPEKQADDSPPALKKLKPLANTASNNTNGNGSGNSLPSTSSGISSAGSSCSSNGPALVSSPAPPPLTPQVPQSPNLLSLPHYISPSNSPPPALPVPLPREVADAATGTSVGTITEPDCLGHCEPGTSVTLEGIVWHETEGVLVVNVTWRGKTYVGTLIDCTKHAWAPPRFCDSPTNELDLRAPKGRGKRGRAAAAAAAANNLDFAETRSTLKLRSNNAPSTSKGRRGPGASSPTQFATPKSDSTLGKRKSKVPDDEQPSTSGTASTSKRRAVSSRSTSPLQPVLLECPEPNCSKKYKHINGLKYHQSHAHGTNVEEEEVKETVTSEEEDHSAAVVIEIKKEETEEPPPPVIDENPEPLEKPLPAPPFNNDDLNDEPPAPLTRACTPTSPSPPLIEPAISDEPPSQPPTLTKVPPLPIKTPPLEDPISPVPSPSSDLNMPQPVMPQIQQPQHDPPMQQSLTEREKQHDVQEFQSQQLPQPQLPQSQTPPLLHTQSQTPPQLHTQSQTPPQLHTQSQTPPQLHTQSQTPPQLHTQSQTPPQLHTQPQTPPQLHTQSQTPPQLHTQSQTPPQLHTQSQTPPQLHTQSQTPPQLHTQSQTPPQLHTQSQTPPQLHTQSQTPPQLHTQSQSQIQSRPVTPLQPQLQLHHHQQLQQQPQPQSQQQLQPHLPQSQQPSHSQLLSSPSQQHHISQIQIQPHLQQQQPLQLSQQHSQQTHSQVTMHQQQQHVLIQQQQHQQIQMQIQHLQQQQQIVQQHQIVQQFHQQSQKKKTKKSPPNSPILSPLEQPPSLGIETTGREGVTSPAYSDISDDAAPLLESEVEGKPKLDDKKDGQSAPMQLCGMYNPYYSQPPYLVPSVPEKAKELLAEKAERESKVLEKEKKEGDYHQQKALAQSYYQYGFHVAGYPYNIEGGYSLVVDDKKEEKAGQISELKQATSTLHIPNPAKLKATELTVPKEKYQNENHQIIKESIEIKNQLNNSFMYQRTQQGQEEVRRYYVYPERKDGSSTKATPPPLSSQRTHPVPSPKQKDKLEDKKERSDEKKQEGVKPTMETQGPPPPPTSQYAYIHPGYMQSPHYGTLPFDPGHPMYRGVNPVIVSSFYPQLPQIHTVGRYAPEDLSRSSTNKTLDLLQNQYYSHSSHKIHELQERAIKSPVPKVTTTISSPSSSSSTPMAITSTPTTMGQGKVTPVDSKDARSPPPQRHVHTHHHTHVGLGYPILASQYPSPYGAAVLASEHAAAVTSVPYQSK